MTRYGEMKNPPPQLFIMYTYIHTISSSCLGETEKFCLISPSCCERSLRFSLSLGGNRHACQACKNGRKVIRWEIERMHTENCLERLESLERTRTREGMSRGKGEKMMKGKREIMMRWHWWRERGMERENDHWRYYWKLTVWLTVWCLSNTLSNCLYLSYDASKPPRWRLPTPENTDLMMRRRVMVVVRVTVVSLVLEGMKNIETTERREVSSAESISRSDLPAKVLASSSLGFPCGSWNHDPLCFARHQQSRALNFSMVRSLELELCWSIEKEREVPSG